MTEDAATARAEPTTKETSETKTEENAPKRAAGSSNATRLHPMWVVLIAVVCLLGGLAAGYELHPASAPSTSSTSTGTTPTVCGQPVGSPTLSVTAAGTLDTAFPDIASELANQSTGAQIPHASENFEGSLAALGLISNLHECFDVAAGADFRLIPNMLENGSQASWEVVFASNPEVLCWNASVTTMPSDLNASNWGWMVQRSGLLMGVANASTDPNGYNEIFTLMLQGLVYNQSESAVYSHFFTGSPGSYAQTTSNARLESETSFASLLGAGTISVAITYRSYAITHHLSYVTMNPLVGLGNFSAADMASYAQVSTTILGSNGGPNQMVQGAPVAFAATVPTNAPNATLGLLFVHSVVSAEGAGILSSLGFTPIVPAYWQATSGTVEPTILAPATTPLPSSLSADL